MSGETHRDDDLEFNDDFVLEDAVDDLETLFDDPPAAGTDAEPQANDAPGSEEDAVLFADTPAAADPGKSFTPPGKPFTEAGGVHWKGFRMTADEIGIPTGPGRRDEAAASPVESHLGADTEEGFGLDGGTELELVEDERQLNAAPAETEEAEGVPYVIEDAEGQLSGAGEAEAEVEADEPYFEAAAADAEDAWAPLPAQGLESGVPTEDSPYIEAEAAEEEGEYTGELVGATAEAEEQYYVEAPLDRIGAPERRRSMRWLSGLVAALLMVGAGTAFFVHPEWFGMGAPQLDNRVQIARPRVDLEVTPPEPMTVPVTPGNTDPGPTQPGGNPGPEPVPGGQTIPDPTPVPLPVPGNQDPIPQPGPVGQGDPGTEPRPEALPLIPAGQILIGGFDKGNRGQDAAKLPDVVAQILPGSNAFVQLRNGNFFIGRVKAVDAKALTMRVSEKMADKGEVNLSVEDITRVASLGTSEYNDLLRATSGFIKLTNSNRLVGQILESVADDYVILEMKSNRILLPKSAIEEIGQHSSGSVGFARGTDEDQWVRRLAEQKLKDLNRRARLPAEEEKPGTRPGPEKPVEPRESAPR